MLGCRSPMSVLLASGRYIIVIVITRDLTTQPHPRLSTPSLYYLLTVPGTTARAYLPAIALSPRAER